MTHRRRQVAWPVLALAVFGGVCWLRASDLLLRFEQLAADTRATVLAREVSSDIVIVGIDAQSLLALNQWPWPRRYHAHILDQLAQAAPKQVFLDIDFSSRSNPTDDAFLEEALSRWREPPVTLAALFQPTTGASTELTLIRPLPRFARHSRLASVVLEAGSDGLVRAMPSSWRIGDATLPSVLSYDAELPPGTLVRIDFSISPASFGYVSYDDLFSGRINPAALTGKTVYVGAIAYELGDMVPVPVLKSVPGVVLQALATESARQGLLRAAPEWLYLVLLAAWTVTWSRAFCAWSWRRNLTALGGSIALLSAATVYLYAAQRIDLGVVPFAAAIGALFLAATLRSLDDQTWRALTYGLGLKRRGALLKSIVESSTDCIVCIDEHGGIRTANPAASRLFECRQGSLPGSTISRFIPDLRTADGDAAIAGLAGSVTEREARTLQGRSFPVEMSVSRVNVDNERLYTAIVRDISERKAQQSQLEHQATHDPLTGLPNRTALAAHLGELLGDTPDGKRVALLMLDLCRFKEVNDTLGHDVGDQVLRIVAERFRATVGSGAFIARIGGDEFTVVLPALTGGQKSDELAQKFNDALRSPIRVRGIAIELGLSIGIALHPDHGPGAQDLLKHADVAMYVSKRRASPYEYYDEGYDQHTVRRLSMVSELRSAIRQNGLSLHYQPQLNLRTGRADSAEALLRWQHAGLGNVSPAEFVTLAESTDLIRPLTDWTVKEAIHQMQQWKQQNLDIRVAVNLSARILQDLSFPDRFADLLARTGVTPRSLELEITESAMMSDLDRAERVVRKLHDLGTLISIDDYGTGFSSLGYLRDLPVHSLKLDKSFVVGLETHQDNRVIVESTLQMGHALGLEVVAEGVETRWVHDYLKNAGYDLGQGFWYSRPLPAGEYLAWATSFNALDARRRAG